MSYNGKWTKGQDGAPLVLTFHGTGGTEEQFHGLATHLVPGAHVTSPRGDVSEMGALRFFRRTGEGIYDMDDLARRTEAMAAFIAAEKARTGADHVMGLGYSNGANILASVMFKAPDLVDDAVLMHPLVPWVPEPQPGLKGRRILITAGARDPICPAPLTRALETYLLEQEALANTFWHPGGHDIRQEEIDEIRDFLAPVEA